MATDKNTVRPGGTDNANGVLDIGSISTKELVAELRCREGVLMSVVEPYTTEDVKVEGPAIVITVID